MLPGVSVWYTRGMATYPQGNPGVAPYDPSSEVGQFRALVGDTQFSEYDPAVPGKGNYKMFSDAEIEALLVTGESVTRAIGFGYMQLAGAAALASKSIKDYDLMVDTTKRATDLRLLAAEWFKRADDEDVSAGVSDIFEVFDTVSQGGFIPEGSPGMWGRRYTWDRI